MAHFYLRIHQMFTVTAMGASHLRFQAGKFGSQIVQLINAVLPRQRRCRSSACHTAPRARPPESVTRWRFKHTLQLHHYSLPADGIKNLVHYKTTGTKLAALGPPAT
jgi:hypothetical protein